MEKVVKGRCDKKVWKLRLKDLQKSCSGYTVPWTFLLQGYGINSGVNYQIIEKLSAQYEGMKFQTVISWTSGTNFKNLIPGGNDPFSRFSVIHAPLQFYDLRVELYVFE